MSRDYPDRPFAGVGVVVVRGGRVLLVRRAKPPRMGQWSLPGGVQELGETVHEAGRREVMEETGVEIEIIGLVDVIDAIRHDGEDRIETHYTLVDLAALWRAGEARAGDDAMGVRWVPVADVPGLGLWSETTRVIALAAEMAKARG